MIRNMRGFGPGWQAAHHGVGSDHVFGVIFMIALLALIVVAIVVLTMWLIRHRKYHEGTAAVAGAAGGTPLDILNVRYARGEIEKAEYEEKRKELST